MDFNNTPIHDVSLLWNTYCFDTFVFSGILYIDSGGNVEWKSTVLGQNVFVLMKKYHLYKNREPNILPKIKSDRCTTPVFICYYFYSFYSMI